MFSFQLNPTFPGRCGGVVALVLTLGLGGCAQPQATPVAATQAAVVPATQAQPDHYYLNGRPSTKADVENLDPKTITRLDVLRGQQAVAYSKDADTKGVVLAETR